MRARKHTSTGLAKLGIKMRALNLYAETDENLDQGSEILGKASLTLCRLINEVIEGDLKPFANEQLKEDTKSNLKHFGESLYQGTTKVGYIKGTFSITNMP